MLNKVNVDHRKISQFYNVLCYKNLFMIKYFHPTN